MGKLASLCIVLLCLTSCHHAQAARPQACDNRLLRVHFYDVGQALSALVDLPDGRHILVDSGDSPMRSGCGDFCRDEHAHLMERLKNDLAGAPLDLVWITHQHSDHIGGALDVLRSFVVKQYADNGRDGDAAEVRAVHDEALARGVPMADVDPLHARAPLTSDATVQLMAIVPSRWPDTCDKDRNECSAMLRIDHCQSSILFTGDEELDEEALLAALRPVTLLQVGHHGSDTSSGPAFLAQLKPRYAVISAGHPGEGLNRTYCHPRLQTVSNLTDILGGPTPDTLRAFDGAVPCRRGTEANWVDVPVSSRLWATERDGDVVLSTVGDGQFHRD